MNLDQLTLSLQASLFSLQLCDYFFINTTSIQKHTKSFITSTLVRSTLTSCVLVLSNNMTNICLCKPASP
uniref:Uncharacterized protein n=1 Tax=Rhizophora mucronata TaxID=61149 RepID=A0A2P2KG12_RHIMU